MKASDKNIARSLCEGFSVGDWLEAEKESTRGRFQDKPKGALTVEEFAEIRSLSMSRSQTILNLLCRSGHARKQRWYDGNSGNRNVYWLKPKKEWPK